MTPIASTTLAEGPRLVRSEQRSSTGAPTQALTSRDDDWRWLFVALGFTFLFTGRTMAPAFGGEEAIQGDARAHIFWMARFRDPELFQDDLIADYFQSVAPPGFSALYWALSWVLDPLLAGKLLPPLLGAIAAVFVFLLVRRLHPAPSAAFLATVLMSWYVWQYDDLASATPRAFMLPLLSALLWALVGGRLVLGVGIVTLAAALYPAAGVLGVALLGARLLNLKAWRPSLSGERSSWLAFTAATALVLVALLPGQLAASAFGPIVSAPQARAMPEFGPRGRNAFFVESPYRFWVESERSGLDGRVHDAAFPRVPILFEYLVLGALLPAVIWRRCPLQIARLSRESVILLQLLLASFGLFFLAHLLIFHLYLPGRFVKWSLPLVLAIAAGLALGILVERLAIRVNPPRSGVIASAMALGIGIVLAVYPARYAGHFHSNHHPAITEYLRMQPKDSLVAGVPLDTDLIPALAARSVLVAREHALAYHLGYYDELSRRASDLVDGYYASSVSQVTNFADRYGVDIILVNRAAFRPATFRRSWEAGPREDWEPFASAASQRFRSAERFALLDLVSACSVFEDGDVSVLPTSCVREQR